MDFIELQLKTSPELADILMAELGELGFDTFMETEGGFNAYIGQADYKEEAVKEVLQRYSFLGTASYQTAIVPKENWNEQWETNYQPIEVPGRCRVRASFHAPDENYPLEIVINPKMSFGTGHHATTHLMMELLLDNPPKTHSVLDLGTGTGILAILAQKLGANRIEASDIDEWCIENSTENLGLNDCVGIKLHQGTIFEIQPNGPFDLVIANINRNVLLEEMAHYIPLISESGSLYLSGFYEQDLDIIRNKAEELGLFFVEKRVKDRWTAASFTKKAS